MSYRDLVVDVMDRVIKLANSQVSSKMWYKLRCVCPDYRKGFPSRNSTMKTAIISILRELGFKVVKREYNKGRVYRYYFLIDLNELLSQS